MTIGQLSAVVLRRWWIILLVTVLAILAGLAISAVQTPIYRATTTVLVGQSIRSSDLSRDDILTSELLTPTYAEIVTRQPVLAGAVEQLGLTENWRELRRRVRVVAVEGTQLIEILVEDISPELARSKADAIADQLIKLSPTGLQGQNSEGTQLFVQGQLESLQARIEDGHSRLAELEESLILDTPAADVLAERQAEIGALEVLITNWESNYTELLRLSESQQSPNYLSVVEPAVSSGNPVSPRIRLNLVVAGTVGFTLGVGIAFLYDYLSRIFRSPLKPSLGLPNWWPTGLPEDVDVERVPELAPQTVVDQNSGSGNGHKLITLEDPFSAQSEIYRTIQDAIQSSASHRRLKSIMITSASAEEQGKSHVVANLGVVMAQAGHQTIILDADMDDPRQQEIFKIPENGGLTALLQSLEPNAASSAVDTGVENLRVVTHGEKISNSNGLLGSERMKEILDDLTHVADMLIIAGPPLALDSDGPVLAAPELARQAEGALLVVTDKLDRDETRLAMLNLEQAGAELLGVVLNQVPANRQNGLHSANDSGPGQRRECACGCGELLPADATSRRRFLNATHRQRYHKNQKTSKISGKLTWLVKGES